MKVTLIALTLAVALAGTAIVEDVNSPLMTQEDVDSINAAQDSWVASLDWLGDMTLGEARGYASTIIKPRTFPERNWGRLGDHVEVPSSFDSRKQWPNCIHPIVNQGQCGSCWAFGATEALSDRFCIDSNGGTDVVLSPQYLVSCDSGSYGCDGGWPDQAWHFMEENGVPTWDCAPYHAQDGQCPSSCSDGSDFKLYHAADVHTYSGPSSIQKAIMEGGPVETAFTVYQDFMSYKSGVYKHTSGGVLGGHAVKIVGWGEQNGVRYWICANSWGGDWGIDGFFWIEFGQCGIDNQGVAGQAKHI